MVKGSLRLRLAQTLATWFGCGLFPIAPGTVGSLAALAIAFTVERFLGGTRQFLFGISFLLLMPAIWAATETARALGKKDPGRVVVDEVLGQWVTLLATDRYNWRTFAGAFVLFRLFDVWKPWPVRQLERYPDGYGIVADDIGAGLYAALTLYLATRLQLF